MIYEIILKPKARKDFGKLDKQLQREVSKKFAKIAKNPFLGEELFFELQGCRKMYVAKKSYRIVYTIVENEIIVEVIAIGRRDKESVYKEAHKRLS